MSIFADVPLGPPIEVFRLTKSYIEDPFPEKVNLGIGAYRTENGDPFVLPVVRKVEKSLTTDESLNKEYLPALGLEQFSYLATKMLLGADCDSIQQNRAFGVQVLSGTGGLRVAAEFLNRILGYKIFYYSNPTWANHKLIFNNSNFTDERQYRYWSESERGLDFKGMLEDLNNAPEKSVIILHACAHNPTGCDPTQEQWKEIANVIKKRKLFPLFDSAYQGFASGDLDSDAWVVRYFEQNEYEFFCVQSFAKNFGLYNERVGNLTIVLNNQSKVPHIKSQLTLIIRGMYSNPPSHGAKIVAYILNNPQLYEQWTSCIKGMSSRIIEMRKYLRNAIEQLGTPGDWSHITVQIGMFSYTGLNERQSVYMVEKHHVYMLKSGRISMCGLTHKTIPYVARAIYDTVTNVK